MDPNVQVQSGPTSTLGRSGRRARLRLPFRKRPEAPPAAPVDADIASLESHERLIKGFGLCTLSSFIGLPAVSVPAGLANGLPQGVQLIGPMYREDLCLQAALRIEAALGRLGPISPK